jgi:hypothetical protein
MIRFVQRVELNKMKMETAYDFLLKKGITKVHQPARKYNLSIAELVEFLDEYATGSLKSYILQKNERSRTTTPIKKEFTITGTRLKAI